MRKLLFILGVALVLASCASIEKYNLQVTKLHPVEDLHEDINNVYKQLKRHHPHLYQYTPKETLDFKFDSLKRAVNTPMDSRSFNKQLAQVMKHVRQGHLNVSPPSKHFNKKQRKELKKMKFGINNLDFEYLDEHLLIVNARGKDSLLIGSEVLKVGDENPKDLIEQYKLMTASDGYNTTFYNRQFGYSFLGYYTKYKDRFDSLTLTLKKSDSTFIKKYKRVLKEAYARLKDSAVIDSAALKKEPKKKLTKVEKRTHKLKHKEKKKNFKKYGYNPARKENARNLTFIGQDSTIAIMKIRSFTMGSYKDFYKETFAKLDALKTETLIIDLRNNGGGRTGEVAYLYSYLVGKKFIFINPSEVNSRNIDLKASMSNSRSIGSKILDGLLSPITLTENLLKTHKKNGKLYYNLKESKVRKPNPLNFKGKIYILINGRSFSASSIISTNLKASKRATFVGEETGGAYNGTVAGMYKIYVLPHTKIKVRIGLMHIAAIDKISPDGHGVMPDVEILPTYKDRLNNIDPELEWILNDIENKKEK